ncbi:MAG: VOC family protein [Acidobacteriota bacterium]
MRFAAALILSLGLMLSITALANEEATSAELTTIALRSHATEAMVAFYSQAFGFEFREVDTFGIRSQFGTLGSFTLKLVPLRENEDFVSYPSHQLGFAVADVRAVIALAEKHGGRQEGEVMTDGDQVHGAIRDPDGNTVELYQQ